MFEKYIFHNIIATSDFVGRHVYALIVLSLEFVQLKCFSKILFGVDETVHLTSNVSPFVF